MKKPDLSIIIPAKNEEDSLPKLLNSVKHQGLSNIEIIIADGDSDDKTVEIAKQYNCKVVKGGKPAEARNNGFKYSKSDYLAFIDADVILPKNFLKKALKEFEERDLDVAGTLQKSLLVGKKFMDLKYKFYYNIANQIMKIMQYTKKPCMQVCMFAKRDIHEKINGFDESIIFGEDSEYSKRASRVGKFGIIKNPGKVFLSPRRFERENTLGLKYAFLNLARFLGHEFRENSKIKYF